MKFENMMRNKKLVKSSRAIALILIAIAIILFSSSCKNKDDAKDLKEEDAELTAEVDVSAKTTFDPNYDQATMPIGLLMRQSDGELSYAAMHGFLRVAENLGYPAKLYIAQSDENVPELVENAIEDGCKGILIWADSAEMLAAIATAKNAGLKVIVPFETVGEGVADANFYQDEADYTAEAARILIERINSRGKTSGNIYITGVNDHQEIVENFAKVIKENYPSFKLFEFDKKSEYENVYKTIEKDADIVALIALEKGSAEIWNDAANNVQADILDKIAPTPTPSSPDASATPSLKPSPSPESSPSPKSSSSPESSPSASPSPEIADKKLEAKKEAAKRYVNILLFDYTVENIGLVERGIVTGLIARPFYDSTAQSVYVMDKLFRGLPTQTYVLLNVPIIKKGYTAKYRGVMDEVWDWFKLKDLDAEATPETAEVVPNETPESTPSADETTSPSPSAEAGESTTPSPSPSNE